jgi:hypothetical protein
VSRVAEIPGSRLRGISNEAIVDVTLSLSKESPQAQSLCVICEGSHEVVLRCLSFNITHAHLCTTTRSPNLGCKNAG